MGSRRWAVRLSGRAAPLKHVLVQLLRNMWEDHKRGVRTRRADWWQQSENMRMLPMLPRVGSLHYLCGHCGHTGHSLLVKPRSEHNLFQPLPLLEPSSAEIQLRGKVGRRPKSLHSSFEPINTPVAPNEGRRKKRRRRTVLGAPSGSPPEHDYESLVSSPASSSSSQMQTLDVRIKVTRAVIRESGEFDTGGSDGGSDRQIRSDGSYGSDRGENGCSVYDNITVRDNITMNDNITVRDGQDNDSWQYTTRIPQDCLAETSWKRSSGQILSDTGQQKDQEEQEEQDEMRGTNENRKPRLKMFKLKCLNKVASFSIFK